MPKGKHKYTLIFLHGLGQNGKTNLRNFAYQAENRITPLNMKIVLPTAPVRGVTAKDDE
jgi:predicted esterase